MTDRASGKDFTPKSADINQRLPLHYMGNFYEEKKIVNRAKPTRRQYTQVALGSLMAYWVAPVFADDEPSESSGPTEQPFERDYAAPDFRPAWKDPQINRTLVSDFVIFAHSDLEMTKKLLEREPGLLNSAMDWGNGDFETALGGASHMGRRDIATFLLSKGARPDLHCAAMLGQLEVVKSLLDLQPTLIDSKGPHGFSLHFHAQVGGKDSEPVLDYLQSIKRIELRPIPFLK